jgi:hypothetical protein
MSEVGQDLENYSFGSSQGKTEWHENCCLREALDMLFSCAKLSCQLMHGSNRESILLPATPQFGEERTVSLVGTTKMAITDRHDIVISNKMVSIEHIEM